MRRQWRVVKIPLEEMALSYGFVQDVCKEKLMLRESIER